MTAQASIRVEEHRRLVTWVISRRGFMRRAQWAVSKEDLVQEGMLGLLRASQTFDPSRGSWSTYATQWVRQYISRFLQDRGYVVRVPVNQQERRIKAGERTHPIVRRIDAPVLREDEDSSTLGDLLADDAPSPEDVALAGERNAELSSLMWRARLSPRERRVLALRSHDVSLEDIGADIGLTRERVRQIEQHALERLRRAAGVCADAPRVTISRAEPTPRGGKRRRKPNQPPRSKEPCHMRSSPQPESA